MKRCILLLILITLPLSFTFADTYNENPIKDTWIWPSNGPYGSSTELRANRLDLHDQKVLLEFDLSTIPSGSTISSAILYVYNYENWDTGTTVIGEIFRITETWDEYTLVDAIAHDDTTPYDSEELYGELDWKEFDITVLVQEWVDTTYTNYGAVFYGTSGNGGYIRFYSREATSDNPYLEIDYIPTSIQSTSLGNIKALFE